MSDLLDRTEHRPYPLPQGPWVMQQAWQNILFAHWPVPVDLIRRLVPEGLEVDCCEGTACLGVTPFWIRGARLRGAPALPFLSTFPEVDVRTYVRYGVRPGVFFLSLHAPNPVVAAAARLVYHMPYVGADVDGEVERDTVWLRSCTGKLAAGPAEWEARYRPVSESFEAEPGTLEYFLMERWALYTVDREGCLHRSKIHRLPWQLQHASADIHKNTLAGAHGIDLPEREPLLHFSHGLDVLVWPPEKVA
jgi:uncharacterized protein YqjF (DUF2071 family)